MTIYFMGNEFDLFYLIWCMHVNKRITQSVLYTI